MKKFTKFLMAAMALVVVSAFTGCKEPVIGLENGFYGYEYVPGFYPMLLEVVSDSQMNMYQIDSKGSSYIKCDVANYTIEGSTITVDISGDAQSGTVAADGKSLEIIFESDGNKESMVFVKLSGMPAIPEPPFFN